MACTLNCERVVTLSLSLSAFGNLCSGLQEGSLSDVSCFCLATCKTQERGAGVPAGPGSPPEPGHLLCWDARRRTHCRRPGTISQSTPSLLSENRPFQSRPSEPEPQGWGSEICLTMQPHPHTPRFTKPGTLWSGPGLPRWCVLGIRSCLPYPWVSGVSSFCYILFFSLQWQVRKCGLVSSSQLITAPRASSHQLLSGLGYGRGVSLAQRP